MSETESTPHKSRWYNYTYDDDPRAGLESLADSFPVLDNEIQEKFDLPILYGTPAVDVDGSSWDGGTMFAPAGYAIQNAPVPEERVTEIGEDLAQVAWDNHTRALFENERMCDAEFAVLCVARVEFRKREGRWWLNRYQFDFDVEEAQEEANQRMADQSRE